MDGEFVPNFTLGTDYCRILKKHADIPLDIHLMINDPENKLSWFDFGEGDYVSVHVESTKHLQRALSIIKSRGAKPMVAINPATPIEALEYVLDDICAVLVMTVNPGFAGQKMIPATLDKIRKLREYLDAKGYAGVEIEVDGNVSFTNAVLMKQAGANIFVGGTSSVFSSEGDICENIDRMRKGLD
jgi:ribulose-phosphate 3-epimerase